MYAAVHAMPPQQVKKQGEVGVGHEGGVLRSLIPLTEAKARSYIEIQPLKESVKYADDSPISALDSGSREKD